MVNRCQRTTRPRRRRRGRRKSATQNHAPARITAPYTLTAETEKGNGEKLQKIRQKQKMIPTTTWKKPETAKKDRWDHQQQKEDMAMGNESRKYKTNTPPPGQARMVNRADESTTSRSMRNTGSQKAKGRSTYTGMPTLRRTSSTDSTQCKSTITPQRTTKSRYHQRQGGLKYDIQELRLRHEKMTKWYKDREKVTTEQEKKRRTRLDILQRKWRQQWAKYIQSEKRPIRRSQHGPRDWKNGDGTKQEIHQLGQSYKKERDALQQEIASHGHKIQARTNKSQQLLTIHAW